MLFNFDLFIAILAIIVFGGLSAYTIYIILPIKLIQCFRPSNIRLIDKLKLLVLMRLMRFSSVGAASQKNYNSFINRCRIK